LRRWLLGNEGGRRGGRARGLEARIGELVGPDESARTALHGALRAATVLPGEGWLRRLSDGGSSGPTEAFLARVRELVLARSAAGERSRYGLEAGTEEPPEDLLR